MDTTASRPPTVVTIGGPERLFAVDCFDAGHQVEMTTGPWSSGPGSAGSLGVLADNVLGYALIADAPAGFWSVSTEIALDFVRPVPGDGSRLRAGGRTVHTTRATGLAEGSIVDQDDRLVARCRQWGRYVRLAGPAPEGRTGPPQEGVVAKLRGQVSAGDGHADLRVAVGDDLVNPIGTLHGGVSLWLAGLTADAAVGSALVPTSLVVKYPRPLPRGEMALFQAEVASRGGRMAVTRVTGSNRAGRPCVIATAHHQSPH